MYNAKKHAIITELARRPIKLIFNHLSDAFVIISFSLEQQGASRPPLCNRTPERTESNHSTPRALFTIEHLINVMTAPFDPATPAQ